MYYAVASPVPSQVIEPWSLPRVPEPSDENEVMCEQLGYLIEHVTAKGTCGCPDCKRYLAVRELLMAAFL
jgi:hypothetical protein